jgi:transcriptional antiterminator
MSVQTNMLAETIEQIELELLTARSQNNETLVSELTVRKATLAKELNAANTQLREGRQLLKG